MTDKRSVWLRSSMRSRRVRRVNRNLLFCRTRNPTRRQPTRANDHVSEQVSKNETPINEIDISHDVGDLLR
jgi:hypothetical protein